MTRYSTEANNITRSIIDLLNAAGHLAWRNNSVGVYDPSRQIYRKGSNLMGTPDIICILNGGGQFLGIEIKAGKDAMSAAQMAFMTASQKLGAQYWIVKSETDFIDKFKKYEKSTQSVLPVSNFCEDKPA